MDTILLTGATGHVGTALLPALLADPDVRVLALVRADGAPALAERLAGLRQRLRPDHAARLDAVRGDVTASSLGLSWHDRDRVASEVTSIVHSAASVRFDMPEEQASALNVRTTEEVLAASRWLAEKGRLKRLDHISTAYVAGDRRGRVFEHELDVGQGFRNSYEWSKCQSEKKIRAARAQGLPVAVHRPSIIVGDSKTGETGSFNVLYWPLKLYARGWWRTFPGRADALVDVVPVDFVADAIAKLRSQPETLGGTFHLAAGDEALTVAELVELVRERIGGKRLRYIDQRFYVRFVRPALLPVLERTRRGAQITRGGAAYMPYFDGNPLFDTSEARARLGSVNPPRLDHYLGKILDFAMQRDFGQR